MEEKTIMLGFQGYVVHNLLSTIKKRKKESLHSTVQKSTPPFCATKKASLEKSTWDTGHFKTEHQKWKGWQPASF